ncbi:MAG: hypothetical protein WC533_01805 [Candidatus Pacearchaeota archaeon]
MNPVLKNIIITIIILVIILCATMLIRVLVGGDEDTWICSAGEWVKHGNPSVAMPSETCYAPRMNSFL